MTGDLRKTDGLRASRRRFLGATAAGALAGVGGVGGAAAQSPEVVRLGGKIAGWQGRAPESIAGETNPTLDLDPGIDYRVVWENLDGMGHNFALLDSAGKTLERTEILSEEGETRALEFTAGEAMAEYVCEPHSGSMRGAISFGESDTATETATRTPEADDGAIPTGPTVAIETIAAKPSLPTDFAVPPDGTGRRYLVGRRGRIHVHGPDGSGTELFLDVGDRLADIEGERGLLGLAFHPAFQRNCRFYLRYSAPRREGTPERYSHTEVLSAFEASQDGRHGLPNSERIVLEIPSPGPDHNAGSVVFGPDGYLYTGMGDGGGAGDTGTGHVSDWYDENEGGNGQDVTENLLGSILRIDVDDTGGSGDAPYAIPEDNPLVGSPGRDEHFAWGFRNPWRMSFEDGRLFVADVGQSRREEVNVVRKGGNYGWNVREGTACFDTADPQGSLATCPGRTPPDVRGGEPLVDPIIEYPHSDDGTPIGLSVIGGYVYENDAIPGLNGKYVFGDYSRDGGPTGSVFAATPANEGPWPFEEVAFEGAENGRLNAYVVAFGRDNAGDLYVLTTGGQHTGTVHRIVPSESESTTDRPRTETTAATETKPIAATDTGTATARVSETGTTEATTTEGSTAEATSPGSVATGTTTEESKPTETAATTATPTAPKSAETGASETSDADGPGFGVLAALAGLAGVAARRLARR